MNMNNSKLTNQEEKFCLVYACGPAPYNGNAKKTYELVFLGNTGNLYNPLKDKEVEKGVESSLKARELMIRDDIRDRIDYLQSENVVNATTLRPRLTEVLLKITDECSTMVYEDRFGVPLSPAALRSVAVNAVKQLTEMYGIKEDIAHKVMLEGTDGEGITFNLIVPENNSENKLDVIDG